jgi:hypothetical protein
VAQPVGLYWPRSALRRIIGSNFNARPAMSRTADPSIPVTSVPAPACTSSACASPSALSRRGGLAALLALPLALMTGMASTPALAQPTSRTVISQPRNVEAFEAIAVAGNIDVVVRQGPDHAIVVEADDNLIDRLETVVERGRQGATLQIRWQRGTRISGSVTARVTVTAPNLRAVASAGSADITVQRFQAQNFSVSMAGSGDIRLDDFSGSELSLRIAGSGDVRGSGRVETLKLSISGSGDAQLADLQAETVTVGIAGSGDAVVQAAKSLKVSIAGSGDVRYVGSPEVSSSIAGSGSVRRHR